MTDLAVISAKDLGMLAMPDFCPKCFWIYRRAKKYLPFNSFPGMFSTIDVATKNWVHAHFDQHGGPPACLADHWGELVGYVDPPSFREFYIDDAKHGVRVRGTADGILLKKNGDVVIVDYKTAWPRGESDPLYPIYQVQLTAYAKIAAAQGMGPVTNISLVYTSPDTGQMTMSKPSNLRPNGFAIPFNVQIFDLPIKLDILDPLLAQVRAFDEMDECPAGQCKCRNCQKIDEFIALTYPQFGQMPAHAAAMNFVDIKKYTEIGIRE